MKNLIAKTAILMTATLIALMTVTPAAAQTNAVRANVPFEFHAGGQTLPAGQYQITLDPVSKLVTVRAIEGGAGAFLAARQSTAKAGAAETLLAFNKYGDTYFLREVRNHGSVSYSWGPSKRERMVGRQQNVEIALLRIAVR
jgi:hypothetical protein